MAIDILGKLFSSDALVKIMRLFLLNPNQGFERKDVAKRSRVRPQSARVELNLLQSVGFIKKKAFYKEIERKSRSEKKPPKIVRKKVQGFVLNPEFPYLKQLKMLVCGDRLVEEKEVAKDIRGVGKISLLLLGGIFIQDKGSRIDLLVVGKNIRENKLAQVVRRLEAQIGVELRYASFTLEEFLYRLDMYDKLVLGILERPHRRVIDTLSLSTGFPQKS